MVIALKGRAARLRGPVARGVHEVNHREQKTTESIMKLVRNRQTSVKKNATLVVARQDLQPTKPATPVNAKPAAPVTAKPETPVTAPATPVRPVTVIEAKIHVGFGNQLFVRG